MSALKRHGTTYRYKLGCRCDDCREAARVVRKRARDRARAQRSPAFLRELAASRACKERYRGTCRECGAPTSGADGPGTAADICRPCNGRVQGIRRRGQGPVMAAALSYLDGGERRFSEIRAHLGITNAYTGVQLDRMLRYGFIVRVRRGVYRRAAA